MRACDWQVCPTVTSDSVLAEESERFFVNRDRGTDACPDGIEMSCGCWMAINKYGGAFGPFQNVTPP